MSTGKSTPTDYEKREEERAQKRELREAADEARTQERHELKMQAERAQLEREERESSEERELRRASHQQEMMLLGTIAGGLGQLMPKLDAMMDIGLQQMAFGSPEAIKASACALLVRAAEKKDTTEALKEAAERLLSISEGPVTMLAGKEEEENSSAA